MENNNLFDKLLEDSPNWWNALKEDEEIYIEIRKNKYIDAYFNGGAIIKKLKWSEKRGYYAKIHAKYLNETDSNKYEECPLESLLEKLSEIKKRIYKFYPDNSEKGIQAKLILNDKNYYIDSEFQDTIIEYGKRIILRFDLVKIDPNSRKLIFQELKRIEDSRLLKKGETKNSRELSEIKNQIKLYSNYISENKDSLLSYYQNIVKIKRKLGLLSTSFGFQFNVLRNNFTIEEKPELIISDYIEAYTEESKKGNRVKAIIQNLEQEKIKYSFVNINIDSYLYKRHLLSITKDKWDSIFAMIPWIERIEKIDPKETYTDHDGKRTRLLKYVEYKSASVQLIGRISRIFTPFDWSSWKEGILILQNQSFVGLDILTTCKLLTILLYYKESIGKLPLLGIPCVAQDLEDGRVLKLLKLLKINIEEEFKKEYLKYQAYSPKDSDFARYARLLQSKWREKKKYPIGKSDNGTEYGNYVETTFAENERINYLTDNVKKLVVSEVQNAETTKAMIKAPRIWNNLLSSQPLCFNLFGELYFNLDLATVFFKKLFPKRIDKVTSIMFEYSPCRGDKNFTGDHSAFDVFVEYTSVNEKTGFIGIEVKYAETLQEGADKVNFTYQKHEKEYLQLTKPEIFKQDSIENLRKVPLFQIWRDHLLSISLLKNNLYEEGFFVFLFPKANKECYDGVNKYCQQLTFPYKWEEEKTGFYWRFIDDFIKNLHDLINQEWTKELKERYLG